MDENIRRWFMAKSGLNEAEQIRAEEQIRARCVKSSKLLEELDYQLYNDKMNGQFYHGKK